MKPNRLRPTWAGLRHSLGLALLLAIPHAAGAALTPDQEEIVRQCKRGEEGAYQLWVLRGRAGASSGAGAAPGRPYAMSFQADLRAVSEEKDLDPQLKRYISLLASSKGYLSFGMVESGLDAPAGAGAPEPRNALPAPAILDVVPRYQKPEGLVLQLVASHVGREGKDIAVSWGETPEVWNGEFNDVDLWVDAADSTVSFAAPQLETGRYYLRLDVGGQVSDPVEFSHAYDGEEREGKGEAGPDARKRKHALPTEGDEGSDVDAAPDPVKRARSEHAGRAKGAGGAGGGGASAAAASASSTGEEESEEDGSDARDLRKYRIHSRAEKKAALDLYREELKANPEITYAEVARKCKKISYHTLKKWWKEINPNKKSRKHYSPEERAELVEKAKLLRESNKTWEKVGEALDVNPDLLNKWVLAEKKRIH